MTIIVPSDGDDGGAGAMDQRQQRILTQGAMATGVTLALGLVGLGLIAPPPDAPEAAVAPAMTASAPGEALSASSGTRAARLGATASFPVLSGAQRDGASTNIREAGEDRRDHDEEDDEDRDEDNGGDDRHRDSRGSR